MAPAPLAVVDQHPLLVVVNLLDGGWVPGGMEAGRQSDRGKSKTSASLRLFSERRSVPDQVLWRSLASS